MRVTNFYSGVRVIQTFNLEHKNIYQHLEDDYLSQFYPIIVKLVFLLVAKEIEIREFPENRDYVIKDLRICSWRSHKPYQIRH